MDSQDFILLETRPGSGRWWPGFLLGQRLRHPTRGRQQVSHEFGKFVEGGYLFEFKSVLLESFGVLAFSFSIGVRTSHGAGVYEVVGYLIGIGHFGCCLDQT